MDRSFFEASVAVPKLSGFDKSFQNIYTSGVGTLTPALCDEVMPGSIIDLDMAASVSLPPLASDTFMRCSLKVEAFFVPMRLLFGGFEHFFVGDEFDTVSDDGTLNSRTVNRLPSFTFVDATKGLSAQDLSFAFGAGTLTDYLGFKSTFTSVTVAASSTNMEATRFSLMPYLAYHKIWDDWYRSSMIQKSCFAMIDSASSSADIESCSVLPYTWAVNSFMSIADLIGAGNIVDWTYLGSWSDLADGINIFRLRQRNFGFDFFTCATPTPQNGTPTSVTLNPASLTTLGQGFTISQLRSMNSLQQFKERNNLAGDRYVDRLYAQYGCRPSDGIAQRVLCIGSADLEVYNRGVTLNGPLANSATPSSQNPFAKILGSRGGDAYGSTNGAINLCHGFKAAEPGYIFVMTSLVPRVTYALGVDSKFTRYVKQNSIGEMANPILQNIGPEPIYAREMEDRFYDAARVFGYTDRYGHFKNRFDELHGLLRYGESLASFAAQRYIPGGSTSIDSSFLEIPTDYLDNVTAVANQLSDYGVWVDSYFRYRVSMPLAKYSLPSLQDPAYEHGKTLTIRRGGFRF